MARSAGVRASVASNGGALPHGADAGPNTFPISVLRAATRMVYYGEPGDPMRRDVYLLAVCVHFLLFGHFPHEDPEHLHVWNAGADVDGTYAVLHAFFEKALSFDQVLRFKDADEALAAFNEATSSAPDQRYVSKGLEGFRTFQKSQRQFVRAYPDDLPVMSRMGRLLDLGIGSAKKFVKLWKKAAWGDQEREGPRILAFLNSARDVQLSAWPHCARVLDVCWLNDAIGLVQECRWADPWRSPHGRHPRPRGHADASAVSYDAHRSRLRIARRRVAHGDLKPDNIVLVGDDRRLVLIDVFDFTSKDDGERMTSAYAPASGGKQERDRYAVTRIAEDLLGAWLAGVEGSGVAQAIETCRTSIPANGTLLPLSEAIEDALRPPLKPKFSTLKIVCAGAKTGRFYPTKERRTFADGALTIKSEVSCFVGQSRKSKSVLTAKVTPRELCVVILIRSYFADLLDWSIRWICR